MNDFIFDVNENISFAINFRHKEIKNDTKIPPNIRQNIYLIFKEALNNVIKHSNARNVDIYLRKHRNIIHFWIKDDGVFDKDKIKKSGLGLTSIKNRVDQLNGKVEIKVDSGFEIICSFPI